MSGKREVSGAARNPLLPLFLPAYALPLRMTDAAANFLSPPGPPAPMPWLEEMPPRQIVAELDRYIVGQEAAKKAVAIAVRNRWRRAQAPDDIRDEITPYNIIMIGPTGVGKTEVARRLARLWARRSSRWRRPSSPKWATSAGMPNPWCGTWWTPPSTWCAPSGRTRSIPQAEQRADERLLDLLLPAGPSRRRSAERSEGKERAEDGPVFVVSSSRQARRSGPDRRRGAATAVAGEAAGDAGRWQLDDREVEVEVAQQGYPMMELIQPPQGIEGPTSISPRCSRTCCPSGRSGAP